MAPLDPIVLFFILGLTPAIYEGLTVLLLISIGLKGGIELAKQPFAELVGPVFSVMLMGFLLPLAAYPVLRYVGRFKRPDAASIAAHYGSVSVGTFAVAVAYLASQDISFESYMPLMVVYFGARHLPRDALGEAVSRSATGQGCGAARRRHAYWLGCWPRGSGADCAAVF